MFYSHAEKVRIAMEVLASCQAEGTTSDYLALCQKRGIICSASDTHHDVLSEFERDILRHVPGGKRAFKDSLMVEAYSVICQHYSEGAGSEWQLELLLRNLANYTDAELACSVDYNVHTHLAGYFMANNAWSTGLQAVAYTAIAARPMTNIQRAAEMRAICSLGTDNAPEVNRALNIHAGLFGYWEHQVRAVRDPHRHYMYRIGTWMAAMSFLENRTGIDIRKQYELSFMPDGKVLKELACGTELPTTDVVFGSGAPFAVLGRQIPLYFKQYYNAKEKMEDAYREW